MDCTEIFNKTLKASREINNLDVETINRALGRLADNAENNIQVILQKMKRILPNGYQ
jgi:hypothetical protein